MFRLIEKHVGDPDDILAYETIKTIRLRDRWLGLLNLVLKVAIFVYVIIFQVVIQKGYYLIEPPAATTRISLGCNDLSPNPQHKCLANINAWLAKGGYPYCLNATADPPRTAEEKGVLMDCTYMGRDANLLVYPPSMGNEMLISTRISWSTSEWACDFTDPDCKAKSTNNGRYFVGGVHEYTLLLDHNVRGSQNVQLSSNVRDMVGKWKCKSSTGEDRELRVFPAWDRKIPITEDLLANRLVSIRELLRWSSLQKSKDDKPMCGYELPEGSSWLDYPSEMDPSAPTILRRYDGVVLLLDINYDNTQGSADTVEYEIRSYVLPQTEYKHEHYEAVSGSVGNPPLVKQFENRHGILVATLQTGKLGQLDFRTLLLTIVSGVVLLGMSTKLTNFLAVAVLPLKKHYAKLMTEVSPDFSDLRDELQAEKVRAKNGGQVVVPGKELEERLLESNL
eukprot:TRINITY_DN1125_c0_g1_i1.p1 TRINITY_DN1125_c0_g1~~TRINITY_DN1125_c0_g1_i1.p1  ORF type:complete len:450 (+),score=110.42 TRINITY_DN1125_c0_g1_i1:186-1535(+)